MSVLMGLATLRAQDAAKKTEPAAGKGAERPLPGQSAFELFEADLFGPLEPYGPKGAVDRVMTAPYRPHLPVMDKNTQDQLEQRRNWVFNYLNDLDDMSRHGDELTKLVPELNPAKQALKNLPPMERYYKELGKAQGMNSNEMNQLTGMSWMLKDPTGTNKLDAMAMFLPGSNDFMKAMLLSGGDTNEPGKHPLAAFGDPPPSPEALAREREFKRRDDEFKRLMDPTLPEVPSATARIPTPMEKLLNPIPATPPPTRAGLPGLPGLPGFGAAPAFGAGMPSPGSPVFGTGTFPASSPANPNPYAVTQSASDAASPWNRTPPKALNSLENGPPKRKF